MADINEVPAQNNDNKKRKNRRSTRVDLTPMVDLGFLLLSFFVFTSALSEPKVLTLVEPYDKFPINDELCERCVITVLLSDSGKIFYYNGDETPADIKATGFGKKGIRNIFRQKYIMLKQGTVKRNFYVIIKPLPGSSFQNLVNMHDECTLSAVARYYIREPNKAEMSAVGAANVSLQNDK